MSFNDCACDPGAIGTVVSDECKINRLPKFARVWFQKDVAGNEFGTLNPISAAASFTGLTASVGDDKLIVLPKTADITISEPDVIEGDENHDGATTKTAVSAQTVVITIKNPNPSQAAAMDDLFCFDYGNLSMFLVTSNSKVMCNKVTDTPLVHTGIKISEETLIGGPPSREGALGSDFVYKLTLSLPSNWYRDSDTVKSEAGFNYVNDVVAV